MTILKHFFASNEIKVALCHLLLKYDFDFVDGKVPEPIRFENSKSIDSKAEIKLRRRKEEIDLDIDLEE